MATEANAYGYGADTRAAWSDGALVAPPGQSVVPGTGTGYVYVPEPTIGELEQRKPSRCQGAVGCGANPAKGTVLCMGHVRSLGKALTRIGA